MWHILQIYKKMKIKQIAGHIQVTNMKNTLHLWYHKQDRCGCFTCTLLVLSICWVDDIISRYSVQIERLLRGKSNWIALNSLYSVNLISLSGLSCYNQIESPWCNRVNSTLDRSFIRFTPNLVHLKVNLSSCTHKFELIYAMLHIYCNYKNQFVSTISTTCPISLVCSFSLKPFHALLFLKKFTRFESDRKCYSMWMSQGNYE